MFTESFWPLRVIPRHQHLAPALVRHGAQRTVAGEGEKSHTKIPCNLVQECCKAAWLAFFQSRFLGRGCDEALFSEKKGFSV